MELALSLIAALCVVTLAVSVAAIWTALRKAPPESNDQLAVRVSNLHIQVEECFDAIERWGKRQSVRDSRSRAKSADETDWAKGTGEAGPAAPAARTGILRQPIEKGARVIGGQRVPTAGHT